MGHRAGTQLSDTAVRWILAWTVRTGTYADASPGKFTHLDLALSLLAIGGIYFIDDLLPQPNWPDGHSPRIPALIRDLENRPGFVMTKLAWATGLMILVRTDR